MVRCEDGGWALVLEGALRPRGLIFLSTEHDNLLFFLASSARFYSSNGEGHRHMTLLGSTSGLGGY